METTSSNASQHLVDNQVEQVAYLQGFPNDRMIPADPTNAELIILIAIAAIGLLGNFAVIIIILAIQSLRKASNAFICHHSILDLIKSGYCLPFAQTMTKVQPITFCNILGSSYIVFVTTTAFNLLALVMNEAYMFSDLALGIQDSRNYCCVMFGIFIIWFGSIIMNLGVAFIPGNPGFDRKVDYCIFVYGITRNYILHILWIVLVTMAVCLTIMYLKKLHMDIKRASYYRLSTLIRATVNIDTDVMTRTQQREHEFRERHHIKWIQRITRKKLALLVILLAMFILFWYPMFLLTVADPRFKVQPHIYKALTLYAWSNPAISPIIFLLHLKVICCCRKDEKEDNNVVYKGPQYIEERCDKFIHSSNSCLDLNNRSNSTYHRYSN